MARLADRLPENAPGDFFVDRSCIDCDTCRFVAPATFVRSDASGQSIVARQPATDEEKRRAAMALVACPTASIGAADKRWTEEASRAFPEPVSPRVSDVLYCGYASEASFGASSYLILRPEGNVLVDSPRATKPLLRRIHELGGAKTMFLTHRDDVADHATFARELGCERVMHEADAVRGVEVVIRGQTPFRLADDLLVVPVPGHTRGSAALLFRDEVLFTGDHLAAGEDGALEAWPDVCWYSWAEQTRSMQRLLAHRFSWVLPGHGRRHHASSPEAMRAEIAALIEEMRAAA